MDNPQIKCVGNTAGENIKTQGRSTYLIDGVCPSLCAGMTHGNTMPYIIVENNDERKSTQQSP